MSHMCLCTCTYLWVRGVPFTAFLQHSALQSTVFWKRYTFKCCGGFLPISVVPETFSKQDGWHILRTGWRQSGPSRQTHLYCCGFSMQLPSDGPGFSALVPLPKWDCHTAGSTYCTRGKVCDSLVGTVCFSPVLVMFLLGCGKNISRGWRDNGSMWLVKGWPQPIIS